VPAPVFISFDSAYAFLKIKGKDDADRALGLRPGEAV
jgi:hypothetical protein